MKLRFCLTISVLLASLSACDLMLPSWQKAIKEDIKHHLIDPASLQIEFICYTDAYKGKASAYDNQGMACATVNAKNQYGGYTGKQLMVFSISNGGMHASLLKYIVNPKQICQDILKVKKWESDDVKAVADAVF